MRASADLIQFLHNWEDCKLVPYRDTAGKWTCGWGHLLLPHEPMVAWTQEKADIVFVQDLESMELQLEDVLNGFVLPQNQYDALLTFGFNLGMDRLRTSTLLKYLRAGRIPEAAAEFTKWGNAGGKPDHGVLKRRCGEQAIFLAKDYSRKP